MLPWPPAEPQPSKDATNGGLTRATRGSAMDVVFSMRLAAVLVALAAVVAAPLPAAADVGAAPNAAALGFDLDAATIPDLQQRMDHGRLTSVRLTLAYLRRIQA